MQEYGEENGEVYDAVATVSSLVRDHIKNLQAMFHAIDATIYIPELLGEGTWCCIVVPEREKVVGQRKQ